MNAMILLAQGAMNMADSLATANPVLTEVNAPEMNMLDMKPLSSVFRTILKVRRSTPTSRLIMGRNRHQNCTQKSATGCVKRLARWRRQTCCTGPTPCLKPAPAKLCAVFCAKLRRAIPATWAIPRRLPLLA